MVMSCHQNAKQNHNLMISKKFFNNVAKYKYLRVTVKKNQNFIQEEVKRESSLLFSLESFIFPPPL
jgi:hypothetical protein